MQDLATKLAKAIINNPKSTDLTHQSVEHLLRFGRAEDIIQTAHAKAKGFLFFLKPSNGYDLCRPLRSLKLRAKQIIRTGDRRAVAMHPAEFAKILTELFDLAIQWQEPIITCQLYVIACDVLCVTFNLENQLERVLSHMHAYPLQYAHLTRGQGKKIGKYPFINLHTPKRFAINYIDDKQARMTIKP